jgi:hypothetical protein
MKELCKAAAFVLTTVDGTTTGLGLLCVDCRYASVRWSGAERIDRRFGTPDDWAAIERELKAGLPTTALSPMTACAYVLAFGTGAGVRWVGWAKRVDVDEPSQTPAVLDTLLSEAADLI